MKFRVEQSGWYRTRNGSEAEILYNPNAKILNERVTGYFPGGNCRILTWTERGTVYKKGENILDLIEYLGKERPKQPKKYCVKVHLWSDGTLWQDSDGLVAVNSDGPFHVETREIEWEVPDNG